MIVTRELIERAEAGLEFDPRPVRRALADRTPTSEADPAAVQRRLVHVLGEGSDASELAIDRIVSGSDALNVSYLERGMIAADAVARIAVHDGARLVGYGTGFMVSPRLLLTNYHVLATADRAVHSLVDFRYEYDALGRLVERATFGLDPAAFFFGDPELDVTVVAVAPETADGARRASDFGWLRLSPSADTALRGEWLSIVQHCGGRPKQLSLRQNLLIMRTGPDLWYVSETATGSSGAPVFNDSWQVVAVHRLGAPARGPSGEILTADGERWSEFIDESRIVWRANVGTRTSAVVARLAGMHGSHPLVQELLREGAADAAEAIVIPLGAGVTRAVQLPAVTEIDDTAAPEPSLPPSGVAPNAPREASDLDRLAVPAVSGNGSGSHPPHELPAESITVTVPLRITVRAGDGGGPPLVGVDLS
jgi:V8-like Glu-specific endopeptidase